MIEFINTIIEQAKQQVTTNQFLSGGLILGMITGFALSLKSIPLRIWQRIRRKILFRVTIEQSDTLYPYLQNWLNTHHSKQLRNVKASFWKTSGEPSTNVRSVYENGEKKIFQDVSSVTYNHYGDVFILFYSGRFLRISSEKEKVEKATSISQLFYESFYIEGLYAKKAIRLLLDEVVRFNLEQEKNKEIPKVFVNDGYSDWFTDRSSKLRDINSVFIPKDQKDNIIKDLSDFLNSKEFYTERNIPYRRGYLLYGPPGTGKSSLVSALASHFKKDLYILNLQNINSNGSFESTIRGINSGFLLIEDIDRCKFNGKDRVDFSTFINAISGVRAKDELILIITTNHISKLDEALLRSGRLDVHLEISKPTIKQVNDYLSWFYSKEIRIDEFSGNMADVENICVQNKYDWKSAIQQIDNTKLKVAV